MPGMSNAGALDAQAEMLMHGCEFGDSQLEASMRERLRARLAVSADEHRPLRVYTGYDPTAPDLHLGHSITLRAMQRFQQLGHHVIVVVGTVTAMVGDTSDQAAGASAQIGCRGSRGGEKLRRAGLHDPRSRADGGSCKR